MNIKKLITISVMISLVTSNIIPLSCYAKERGGSFIHHQKNKKVIPVDPKVEYMNLKWWDRFNDPILTGYIIKAADSNYDIKINSLRVKESEAYVREAFGKELPNLMLNANYMRQKHSGNLPMGSFKFPSYTQTNINFPLNVNYEIDIWGKNRTNTKKVKKELDVVKHEEKSQFISLTSTVASVYFNVLNTDKQIQKQKELVAIRKEILELIKEKYDYGLVSATEVTIADKAYTESISGLEVLEKQQNILLNQLAILIGDSSEDSLKLKRSSIDDIKLLGDLPITVPADIVDQRPDILRAEAQLQSAVLDVSLAKKNFLPSINLSGISGFNANSMSSLINWQSYVLSAGAGLVQPIFTGGQTVARLKAKKYKYEQLLENYQKTILTSIQEVNDSLVAIKFDTMKNNNDLKRIELEKIHLNSVNYKYEKGAVSYLDTLQYKENLLVLEMQQIQSKTDCLIDSLSLYKSVGGKL